MTLAYLTIMFFLHVPFHIGGPPYPDQQRWTILLQTYILSWILLVLATVVLHTLHIGGVYFLVGWNLFVFIGCLSVLYERLLLKSHTRPAKPKTPPREEEEEVHGLSPQLKASSIREIEETDAGPSSGSTANLPTLSRSGNGKSQPQLLPKPTERTPLIFSRRMGSAHKEETGAVGWWILQLAIVIPIPVLLFSHVLLLFVQALNQTLTDGSNPVIGALFVFLKYPIILNTMFSIRRHGSPIFPHRSPNGSIRLQSSSLGDHHSPLDLYCHHNLRLVSIPILPRKPHEGFLPTAGYCRFERRVSDSCRVDHNHWSEAIRAKPCCTADTFIMGIDSAVHDFYGIEEAIHMRMANWASTLSSRIEFNH